ncbi:SIR2 family protein [Paenilisteria newyorkensis]|uniref:SIR2 family protein n=1 Tax=Listeria newyorkensis TaxID=1497681 RepID=UPI00066A107F|nr:SIR2 family protein [Listeria newyorkensis]KMT62877.1 hypothetical protein X559_0714 [Listeria newyorkensis]
MSDQLTNIFTEIKKSGKLPLLFVGSGISLRYLKSYQNWKGLLESCISMYSPNPQNTYDSYMNDIRYEHSEDLSDGLLYQHMGKRVEYEFNKAYLNGAISLDFDIPRGESAMKYYISNSMNTYTIKQQYMSEIDSFKLLRKKLLTVITTNYDNFLKNEIFSEHDTIIGQEVFRNIELGVVMKIHGSVEEPKSIIITKDDYDKFEKKSKILYAKLISLFIDNPVIFIGYSISDENIKKILSDIYECLDSSALIDQFSKRLIFIEREEGNADFTVSPYDLRINSSTTISMTKVKTDNFELLFQKMQSLETIMELRDIKRLKGMIYNLVEDYNATKTKLISVDDIEDNDSDYAVVIGNTQQVLNKISYGHIPFKTVIQEAIFEDTIYKSYDMIARQTLPYFIRENKQVPIFKFINSLDDEQKEDLLSEKLVAYYKSHSDPKVYINRATRDLEERYSKYPNKTLMAIFEDPELAVTPKQNLLLLAALDSEPENILEFLKQKHDFYYGYFTAVKPSTFKSTYIKLVCIYDCLKYQQ